MKHYIINIILFACLTACNTKQPVLKTGLEGKSLPSFNLRLLDSSTQLNTGNIPSGKSTVLFFFSPNCPYCRAQTQDIVENMQQLSNINFYVFSNFQLKQIKGFNDRYHLNKYRNIVVGQDYQFFFNNYFKITSVPFFAIYSKDKNLKQVLVGKTDTKTIKEIALK